ncbi:ornithine cyclodeaminase family protein [Tenacibaculum finnmarkense]|uniref:Ornithine cyclodeaminase family protein n=1 Tax=Tenacibaculum finnmarkense genomovar finnmarkense TaxID=1458503 RepID=A0AAP1RG87_9FLAO|nr:ornithine cyclodeaminase family protein [Tenacibaculum finnmarkense]MBE7653187.1 ornithine cyclodeaminase family protein [Tenacibaculum finnmarkense genomovar finnmarkense]MBE7695443.1 ornithine cyclodeaminase family protein [Tenacibaculum finnmarkense genomovar finnmarkense]MCD8427575.1 ornithine cyclodeaminase family protein [Tenacibaculum finnmarkense genomovar finnmarkense]MCG8731391.1 ornithine cyclodeaminase family protein [Tenacibaculum finnmarkense]MCG8751940.1 ornithine cyclodeamin
MEKIIQIDSNYIENNTNFSALITELKAAFSSQETLVPMRHHHDFANPAVNADSTLLLMPAWNPSKNAGVKIVTVSPENSQFDLPSINGTYIYLDAVKGTIKAILEAKNLTVKRTASASALASSFLSKENSSSLLMIGTGALSVNLIKAHASVRPIKNVFIWGRNFSKAQAICEELQNENFTITAVQTIEEKISEVDIISCATLSKTPLVLGKYLKAGQHVDLVGAYKKDMREADDQVIKKGSVYIDTFQGGLKESGDIFIPLQTGILKEEDIKADLFQLCSSQEISEGISEGIVGKKGRENEDEITVFKSVGHALEDLTAANYFYNQYTNQ